MKCGIFQTLKYFSCLSLLNPWTFTVKANIHWSVSSCSRQSYRSWIPASVFQDHDWNQHKSLQPQVTLGQHQVFPSKSGFGHTTKWSQKKLSSLCVVISKSSLSSDDRTNVPTSCSKNQNTQTPRNYQPFSQSAS